MALPLGGPVSEDGQRNFYVMGPDRYLWSDSLRESADVNEWVPRE